MQNVNCLSIENLSALYDNQLENYDRNLAYGHLGQCKDCSYQFDLISKTSANLRKGFEQMAKSYNVDLVGRLTCQNDVCSAIVVDLSAFVDNELTQAASEGIKSHLKHCKPCLAKFNGLRNLNQTLQNAFKLPNSHNIDLVAAIKDKINNDCKQMASDFSAFLDSSLNTTRHYEITKHLMACSNCQNQIDKLMDVSNLIKTEYRAPMDVNLLPGIQNKLKLKVVSNKPVSNVKNLKLPKFAIASVASFVVLLLAGTVLLNFPNASIEDKPLTAESYILDNSFLENSDYDSHKNAEVVLYEQP